MAINRINHPDPENEGKWCRPCDVVVHFHNVDLAMKFAEVMDEFLTTASAGGDYLLALKPEGGSVLTRYLGHDVQHQGIDVVTGIKRK